MFRSYGVRDWDHFDRLWEKSKGRCGICDKRLEYDGKATHIDHDHVSGEARGVLCHHCNLGLGHFKDDPELLQKAAGYLRDNIFMR